MVAGQWVGGDCLESTWVTPSSPLMAASTVSTYLLLVIGLLGALDIALFHTRQHRLRTRPSARHELVTHALRGPTYAFLFVVVPNFAVHGAWFLLVLGVLAFDVVVSLWDFAIEKRSRAPMGGLPTGEYVLHNIIAMLFGAFVACYCIGASSGLAQPSGCSYDPNVPWPVQMLLGLMTLGVVASGIADAMAVGRLRRRE